MSLEEQLRARWTSRRVGTPAEPDAGRSGSVEEGAGELEGREAEPAEPHTFISAGARFEGDLALKGDFFIDSEFRGTLATDGSLHVGPNGSVEGAIRAREVVIEGAVVGNVSARRLLVLRASARLHGDVETACFEVERHAFFRGRTQMTQPLVDQRADVEDAAVQRPAAV